MRQKSNKNFTIKTEFIKDSNMLLLRSEIQNIIPTDNITILASQPGIGKTTFIINRIEKFKLEEIEEIKKLSEKEQKKHNHMKFAVLGRNHDFLEEEYLPRLKKYGAEHIKGVTYTEPKTGECKCSDPKMVGMHDMFDNNIKLVCGKICELSKEEKNECPYFKQNKKADIILAFISNTNYGIGKNELIIDESITGIKEIKKAYEGAKLISDNFYNALKNNDSRYVMDHRKSIQPKFDR